MGVSVLVGKGRFRFDIQRVGDNQGGGNAPGNDDRPVIRAGVQSSNLRY